MDERGGTIIGCEMGWGEGPVAGKEPPAAFLAPTTPIRYGLTPPPPVGGGPEGGKDDPLGGAPWELDGGRVALVRGPCWDTAGTLEPEERDKGSG